MKEVCYQGKNPPIFVMDSVVFVLINADGKTLTVGMGCETITKYADEAEKNNDIASYYVLDNDIAVPQSQFGYTKYKKWKCPE